MITLDDFLKIEIKIGTILEATKIPEGDKLLKLIIDFGDLNDVGEIEILTEIKEKYPNRHIRQVMSAIAEFYPDPSVLVGKQIPVITNLEPRKFRGYESQGMIMATDDEKGIVLLMPERKVKSGIKLH